MTSQIITLSILLVEDSPYKIERIQTLINDEGHIRLTIAMDQIEAQRKMELEKFDLLILDMQLPLRQGEEPEIDGGEKILIELDSDDSFKVPNLIIALTQHDQSEQSLRDTYPDIAVIKYENSSVKWESALKRLLARLVKSKVEQKFIIYCEGQNAELFNLMGIENIEFRGLPDCRAVYLAAKNEKDKYALRDRDFLTSNEVTALQKMHPNYFILDYYCFENYLYHPENIKCLMPDFDKAAYEAELVRQKRAKLMTIVQDYKISRSAYFDFNDNGKSNMDSDPEKEIVSSLESDEIEKFYPYFDMAGKKDKNHNKSFNKDFLAKYNLSKELLAKTSWFKSKVTALINF